MLVIGRKTGESIILDGGIKITIVSLGQDKVSIGIDAPKEVQIFREELMEATKANREAVEPLLQTPTNAGHQISNLMKGLRK